MSHSLLRTVGTQLGRDVTFSWQTYSTILESYRPASSSSSSSLFPLSVPFPPRWSFICTQCTYFTLPTFNVMQLMFSGFDLEKCFQRNVFRIWEMFPKKCSFENATSSAFWRAAVVAMSLRPPAGAVLVQVLILFTRTLLLVQHLVILQSYHWCTVHWCIVHWSPEYLWVFTFQLLEYQMWWEEG